jgi:hypothetical protein
MRDTFLTVIGSVLIVAASVQFAAAAERHHGKRDRAVTIQKQSRNSDSYAAWPAPGWYDNTPSIYRGGYSAPAGH